MQLKTTLYATLALLLGLAAGCTEENKSRLASFHGGVCKKEVEDYSFRMPALYTNVDEAALPGLKCISWNKTSPDSIMVDLINFEGACGAEWTGEAVSNAPGHLELKIVNPDCLIAACGWCIYDWSIEAFGIEPDLDLDLDITIDTCPGEQDVETDDAIIPGDSPAEGIKCRYANWNALTWQAANLGTCGTLHMPCSDNGGGLCEEDDTPCQGDLVCEAPGDDPDKKICMQPCLTDDNCPQNDILGCHESLCRLKTTW